MVLIKDCLVTSHGEQNGRSFSKIYSSEKSRKKKVELLSRYRKISPGLSVFEKIFLVMILEKSAPSAMKTTPILPPRLTACQRFIY